MQMDKFSRSELLLGREAMDKLKKSKVAVFGIGGVGGYVCEALARCGVGALDLFDKDTVSESNINRQIIALSDTVGLPKVQVMLERIKKINQDADVNTYEIFYLPETADKYDFKKYDYIVDAVDTVTAKIEIAVRAEKCGVPVISCMGTGNKLDPTALQISDIYSTSVCPLARVMRRELKARNIKNLKVLYSKETPIKPKSAYSENGKAIPGSVSFVPSAAGLIIAGEVIKDIIKYGE